VGDDRVRLDTGGKQLLVRAVGELAGLIEIRGLGIRRCDFVREAEVGLVVDLAAGDAERLPPPEALQISIFGVEIPRIPVGAGFSPLPLVVAALTTASGLPSLNPALDCFKGIGNHITGTLATE
jgi:serine kinase of HPr protein (carbohydrate metabolism regulator)